MDAAAPYHSASEYRHSNSMYPVHPTTLAAYGAGRRIESKSMAAPTPNAQTATPARTVATCATCASETLSLVNCDSRSTQVLGNHRMANAMAGANSGLIRPAFGYAVSAPVDAPHLSSH